MPKIKEPKLYLIEAQERLNAFRYRAAKHLDTDDLRKIDDVMLILQSMLDKFAQNTSITNFAIDELIADNMAAKPQSVRSRTNILKQIYQLTNAKEIAQVGLAHGLSPERIKIIIGKAPIDTPLGQCIARSKAAKLTKDINEQTEFVDKYEDTTDLTDEESTSYRGSLMTAEQKAKSVASEQALMEDIKGRNE